MVLKLPPIPLTGVPPDVQGATGREAGHGAGMAGHGPTGVEVAPPLAGAHEEPVGGILTGMAARKGHGRRRQGRAGRRGTDGWREGAAATTAPTTRSNLFFRCRGAFVS